MSDMTTLYGGSEMPSDDMSNSENDMSNSETFTSRTRGKADSSNSSGDSSGSPPSEKEPNAQQEASENTKNKLQAQTNELLAQTNVVLASEPLVAMRQNHASVDAVAPKNESEDDSAAGWYETRWNQPIGWGVPFPFPARKPRPVAEEGRTSVVIRNFPKDFTRAKVARMLDQQGFAGQFNFLYVPIDFRTGKVFGWAFINLVHPGLVGELWQKFDGYQNWPTECQGHDRLTVVWLAPDQGLRALVDRYRNSRMMHKDMPDDHRPAIFFEGMRVVFPPATRSLKAPLRRSPGGGGPASSRARGRDSFGGDTNAPEWGSLGEAPP